MCYLEGFWKNFAEVLYTVHLVYAGRNELYEQQDNTRKLRGISIRDMFFLDRLYCTP